jgi:polysaccharide pyruvyl transferase WcaK-like protein
MRLVERLTPGGRAKRAVTDDLAWLASSPISAARRHAIAISARPWKDSTPRIIDAFAAFCKRATADGWETLPASFDRGMDDIVLAEIAPGASQELHVDTAKALAEGIASVQATAAMRLHAGIFSVSAGVAPTMVSYDEKVTAFAASIGQPALQLANLTGDMLWEQFQRTEADRPALEMKACIRRDAGLRRAQINIDLLEGFLQEGRTPT